MKYLIITIVLLSVLLMWIERPTTKIYIPKTSKEITIRQYSFNARDIISIELMDSTLRYFILTYRVDKHTIKMICLSMEELINLQKLFGAKQ